jgi:tetratricopeptide (TPR) repeat protein
VVRSANVLVVSPRSALGLRTLSWLVFSTVPAPWIAIAEDATPAPFESSSRSAEIAALREWRETTAALQAAIEREQSRNGPRSRGLIELYMSLGLAQQEHGEQESAVEAFRHALDVKRANDGLYNLEQAPMIVRMQASESARGNLDAAAELETALLRLAQANPLDARSGEIWHHHGDLQMAAYERYLAGERSVPTVTLHFGGPMGADAGLTFGSFAGPLALARSSYSAAIRNILGRGDIASEELVELEHDLIRSYYLEAESIRAGERYGDLDGLLALGEQSYQRLLGYAGRNGATPFELASTLVEIADWRLVFAHNGEAVELYDKAYRMLADARVPEAAIRELFPTDRPALLPAFRASPFESGDAPAQGSYVDLAFELSKYGVTKRIRVTGGSGAGDRVEKDAVSIVARNRFRPPPEAGGPPDPIYRVRYLAAP